MTSKLASLLRQQAFSRLASAILVATLVILALGWATYLAFRQQAIATHQKELQQYYGALLSKLESDWETAATQTRSRLEFTRIMEEPDATRWPKLSAYMAAQWTADQFSNVLILDAAGTTVFSVGAEVASLQALPRSDAPWAYLPKYGEAFRVYRLPLWLGPQGQGTLLLFKPISNAVARSLAVPTTELALRFNGYLVAESRDEFSAAADGNSRYLRTEIPWPGGATDERPILVAYRDLGDTVPWANYLLQPIAAAVLIAVLLWFGLGRWLSQLTNRIEALGRSAALYRDAHSKTALIEDLQSAHGHGDEVEQTAIAIANMVEVIEAREQEQRSYLETLSLLEEAVIELDRDMRILRASPGWRSITHRDDTIGHRLDEFIHREDAALLYSQCQQLYAGEKTHSVMRLRLLLADARDAWIECRLLCHYDSSGRPESVRGILRDITQTYLHEKQITHMALHDSLTSLPNRTLLEDRVKVALRLASRSHLPVGICFIDLDNFKLVNDSLGHKAGDHLLNAVAERLKALLRSGDTLARWGGDEFVLLLPEMASEKAIRNVAEKVQEAMQFIFELDGSEIRATFSMGVAIYPSDGTDAETLFSHADRAMFHAKAQGRNQACFFQDMTNQGLGKTELHIQSRLASAIGEHKIEAWYQPIIDAHTGQCASVEVLARWHDDEHGWVSPATFIPMAENLGLIRELGQHILLTSLDAAQRWRERGWTMKLAVNLSKRQLFVPTFLETLLQETRKRGLSPDTLVLEITESVALTDVERSIERLQQLRQAGFQIAVDDFGTGYSSLSQLHEIRADELKIDISFVRRVHQPEGLSMVQAIISLARSLHLRTIAEGVEDAATAAKLRELGVDMLQGYHFAKPMNRELFESWRAQYESSALTG